MLTDYGYGNLAYLVATNPTAPGWGQWFLQCGATTMWEAWEDSSCDTARSRDHAFMGTVDDSRLPSPSLIVDWQMDAVGNLHYQLSRLAFQVTFPRGMFWEGES